MNFLFKINVCRVCMQNDQTNDLLSDKALLEKFIFTTRIAISEKDNLPKSICSRCTARLKVAYTFIKSAQESENNLKTFLNKISTEFKVVAQGNKPIKKLSVDHNFTEDELLSLMDDEDHEDTLSNVDTNRRRIASPIINNNNKKYKIESESENSKNYNDMKSGEKNSYNCDKEETIYRLSKDVLLIHGNTIEVDSEFEKNSHFMEISAQEDDEDEHTDKENFAEDVQGENELEINQPDINTLGPNDDSETHSQSTELCLIDSEENHDYETIINSQVETLQYQSIYVDESTAEEGVQKDDSYNIYNLRDEEGLMDENLQTKTETGDEERNSTLKFSFKKQNFVHRFYCEKCNRDFSTKTNLNRHMQSHEGSKPFSCTECNKSFTQKSTLKQHMYTHTGERPYVCKVCNRGFTQCKSLIFHMRRHTGEKPFHCEYCLTTFRQKDALRIHILKHHVVIDRAPSGIEIFTCIICQRKFDTKSEFKKHMKVHTATAEVDNVMELIKDEQEGLIIKKNKSCSNTTDLQLPLDTEYLNAAVVNVSASSAAEPSRAKKFQCRKCFKCFALKKSLMRHMRIHYVNDSEKTECLDCETQFSSAEIYQEHLIECHQYTCSGCPELIFRTIQELKIHMFEHEFDQQ